MQLLDYRFAIPIFYYIIRLAEQLIHTFYTATNIHITKKSLEICTQLEVVYVAFLMDEWCFFLRNLRYFQIFSPPRLFSFLIYPLLSSSSYVKFRGKLINEKFIARDDLSTKSWHHQYAIKSSLKISCKSIHTSIRILLEIVDTKMQKRFFFLWSFEQKFF